MRTPCQGRCCIVSGECPGCGRTLEEVRNWTRMTDEERDAVMDRLEATSPQAADFYLVQVGWSGRFPKFAAGDLPEGTDRVTAAQWFTYQEARLRYRANRAETPWPLRIVSLGRDHKDRFDPSRVPTWERTAARDLRTKMITEGRKDDE